MSRYNAAKPTASPSREKASLPAYIPPAKPLTWYEQLYDEQKRAVEFVESRPATALFCKPGVGKTWISLAVLERTSWNVALIVAPLTSLNVTWYPKLKTLPNCRTLRSPEELVSTLKNGAGGYYRSIVLTNPEALRGDLKRLSKLPWDIVIWDESQNIKNRNSRNSRIARRLRYVPRRIALSGTPIDTGQIDIWAQMRFVDCGVFGESWAEFANEYCYKTGWMGKEWAFSERKHEQFTEALRRHVFRLDDAFLGLEPITIVPVPIMLLGSQARIYEAMQRDNLVTIDGAEITAHNRAARDVKLSQITGGAVLDRDYEVHPTGTAKKRKLQHLLRKIDQWPIVIFCQFLHELDIVLDLFDEHCRVATIRGSVKEKERTRIVHAFQAGEYDVLICQIRTGGESIDLTRASTLIMYSMTYSYINFEQVLRRVQRGGQTKPVTAYILYCESTIDAEKLDLVQDKSETSFRVLGHFEE
jgi:SNF2 family DNA or RNA helicase